MLSSAVGIVAGSGSEVAEAPPLTPLGNAAQVDDEAREPDPAAFGPDDEPSQPPPLLVPGTDHRKWSARRIALRSHPLDVVFSPSGESIYVSADDAMVREYDVATGKLLHRAKVPAQGDRLRLLHGRYLAVLRKFDAAHIPVKDIQAWDREPMIIWSGLEPADVLALPDGKTVVVASRAGKRLSWWDLSDGRRLADIRLPHATRRLYLFEGEGGRSYVGAMGMLMRARRPAGAWIDLFDPSETPFGATRRSISVGRDPRAGSMARGQHRVLFPDFVSNVVTLMEVDGDTRVRSAPVGQGPVAAFLMHDDRFGLTLDSGSRTVTVIDIESMSSAAVLMLSGVPRGGARSHDQRSLFVSLGGASWPPTGSQLAVVSGDPPAVVATLTLGRGVSRVAASPTAARAAAVSYFDRAVYIVEAQ